MPVRQLGIGCTARWDWPRHPSAGGMRSALRLSGVCLDMLAPGSNATACSARCSQYGDVKCSFSLDRYGPLLIHLAQLR
eukprot:scaffold39657_cov281-Isochrysis_galbana.AAC.1